MSSLLEVAPKFKKVNANYIARDKIDPLKFIFQFSQWNSGQFRADYILLNEQIIDLHFPVTEVRCKQMGILFQNDHGPDFVQYKFLGQKMEYVLDKAYPKPNRRFVYYVENDMKNKSF